MKKQLITIAIASTLLAGTNPAAYASTSDDEPGKKRQYVGTGIGAVAGGILAGPVGVLAGGLIGNLAGRHDQATVSNPVQPDTGDTTPLVTDEVESTAVAESPEPDSIMVSQAGDTIAIIDDSADDDALKNTLVDEIGLDVLFLSGSTTVETLYKQRLQAVARIMEKIPETNVHLEGYSDRRGDRDTNLELANERLEAVRDALKQAGVDANRIHMHAFGEQQFLSKPGDLEAYTFDRRVAIRLEVAEQEAEKPLAMTETGPSL
ncbi:MAG: OmpA family protein [Thiotrichales bacterium]|nr:MAG: OmpA family protein [Thiotrichales bacterium]